MVLDLPFLGANYGSKKDLVETPLHLAARHPRADVAKRLLDDGAANYGSKKDLVETPLHLAARHPRADVAKRLLDDGADANARDRFNRTPLHLAIEYDAQGVFQVNNT